MPARPPVDPGCAAPETPFARDAAGGTASETAPRRPSLLDRLHRALGPVLGGLALDFADFASFGPTALWLGPLFGAGVGLWIGSMDRFRAPARAFWAVLAAVYCTAPFTEMLPLATLISAVSRFAGDEPRRPWIKCLPSRASGLATNQGGGIDAYCEIRGDFGDAESLRERRSGRE